MSESIIISNIEVLAPVIEVKGEIVSSNFDEIKKAIREGLSNINLDPKTNEEFGQSSQDKANIKTVELTLKKAKEKALKQAQGIQALFDDVDEVSDELRGVRLKLEKLIAEKTTSVKRDIYGTALNDVNAVTSSHYEQRITDAMKGKRTLKSLKEAAEREVLLINIEIQAAHEVIADFESKHGKKIALDKNKLELMNCESLKIELQSRVDRLAAEEEVQKAKAETNQVKQESVKLKREVEESSKPPSPKNALDKREEIKAEWDAFTEATFEAFRKLRNAGDKLKFTSNKGKLASFKKAVNLGWKEVE